MKLKLFFLSLIGFVFFLSACNEPENNNTIKPGIVTFFNASGTYYVDLYKNNNPTYFDPHSLVYTFSPGETKPIEIYPSSDQVMGDAFYPQYKIRLADLLETKTVDIFVPAQRVMTNLTFVIKSGDRITKTIPHPNQNELTFYHAYLVVKNNRNTQIQVVRGSAILPRMDNSAVFLNTDDTGYYIIEFTPFDTVINMSQLSAFSSEYTPFPVFSVERGKKYSFTVGDTISNPLIENIIN